MESDVISGVGAVPVRHFIEPGAGDHGGGGLDVSLKEVFLGGLVGFVTHADVVGMEDEDAVSIGVAEFLCPGLMRGGLSHGLGEAEV